MEKLNPFELAGYSKEESKEFIRICRECGVDYNVLIGALRFFVDPIDIEDAIREHNAKGY